MTGTDPDVLRDRCKRAAVELAQTARRGDD
jgi:hypothetical protein